MIKDSGNLAQASNYRIATVMAEFLSSVMQALSLNYDGACIGGGWENDVETDIPCSFSELKRDNQVPAVVVATRETAPNSKVITLRVQGNVKFCAGQYLCFYPWIGEEIFPGQYSVASSPSQLPIIEVAVTKSNNPRNLRNYLHQRACVGDRLWVDSVGYGTVAITGKEMISCPLAWNGGTGGICLLGGGSAISSLVSIARRLCEDDSPVEIALVHSVRTRSDMLFYEELKVLENAQPNMKVIHTVTAGEETVDGWTGRRGRIDRDLLLELVPGKQLFCVFGSGKFCKGAVDMLLDIGVWPANIRSDFSTRIDPSAARETECKQDVELTKAASPCQEYMASNGLDEALLSMTKAAFKSKPTKPLSFAIDFLIDLRAQGVPEVKNQKASSPEFWIEYWQSNAITWQNPEVSPWLREVCDEFLGSNQKLTVFVPLCGKSRDMTYLLSLGMEVVGADCSGICCTDFFHENNIPGYERLVIDSDITLHRSNVVPLRLYQGDIFALDLEIVGPIDRVLDRAALVALHPTSVESRYLPLITTLLVPETGKVLLASVSELPAPTAPPHCYPKDIIEPILHHFFGCVNHKLDYRYKLDTGYVTEPIYLLEAPLAAN